MIPIRVRATAAASTAGAFTLFWLFILSAGVSTESQTRQLLFTVVALLALLFAGRVWQRAANIAGGSYTAAVAAVEGGILGVIVSVAIALHLYGNAHTATSSASHVFYYQALPSAALFGLALGVGNAMSLFFLARRLLSAPPQSDDA